MKQDWILGIGAFWKFKMKKQASISFCFEVTVVFVLMDKLTLRITVFPCQSMKCHYSMLRLVCGVLWVQLELLDPFYLIPQDYTEIFFTSWHNLSKSISVAEYLSQRHRNCSQNKQLCALFRECFWPMNIAQGIAAPSFDRSEPVRILGLLVIH